jgi:hypothetical protein
VDKHYYPILILVYSSEKIISQSKSHLIMLLQKVLIKIISVLGVTVKSKLQWSNQVCNVIKKVKKLNIHSCWNYFNKAELNPLATSNFVLVLFTTLISGNPD